MKFFFSLSFFSVLLIFSCKTRAPSAAVSTSGKSDLTEKEQLDFSYLFYDAMKDKMLGNYSSAQNKLQQALRINPRSAASHYELSLMYLKSGINDFAEISGQNAVKFDPSNTWYKLSLASIYEQGGKFDKLTFLLEDIVKSEPLNPEYKYALASSYSNQERFDDARKIYDELEKTYGVNEELALQKKTLYLQMKKPEKAIEEIRNLMKMYPDEVGYRGFIAEIYESMGQPEKALAEYEEIIRLDPGNPQVYFSLANYYRDQGQKEKSFDYLKKAFANPETDFELKMQVLSTYFDVSMQFNELSVQAVELCKLLIAAHPNELQAHAVYGDFLLKEEKLEEARAEYMIVLEGDKSRFSVWNQVIIIESELKNYQRIFELSKEAMELFPNQPSFFLYNGIAAMQLKQYADAVDAFKAGADVTVANAPLSAQFYASLGDSYNYLLKYTESNASYEKALTYDSKNTQVLNNYAYYLSLRKENLSRARELSERCNALEPDNASYEDTYAWILYELKEYEKAAEWIEKAIKNGGIRSGTIIEHKGDILYRLNRVSEAVESWKQAKALGVSGEELEKKISTQKLPDL